VQAAFGRQHHVVGSDGCSQVLGVQRARVDGDDDVWTDAAGQQRAKRRVGRDRKFTDRESARKMAVDCSSSRSED
jgi:hypothetical protein